MPYVYDTIILVIIIIVLRLLLSFVDYDDDVSVFCVYDDDGIVVSRPRHSLS